ncbi:MAG: metallophosphoesterase [Rhodospirillaceae bacterium]|nr:metallophosphoesterase [Rhodospirillaceae bacterium]|tara:strand:+ start:6852 stop:7610 length:759 start_codon:yes stop_codon:yes gene_type:complete
MFGKLFGKGRQQMPPPSVTAGSRVYVIGDIHGRVDLLHDIHQQILQDISSAPDLDTTVIYLVDYVDRGDASCAVIDLLVENPLAHLNPIFLSGNHEQMMVAFLEDIAIAGMWLGNGGNSTLLSYAVGAPTDKTGDEKLRIMQRDFRAKLPPEHLEFLRSLSLYHIEQDYLFVHAGVAPGVPIEDQGSEDFLWIRDEFLRSRANHGHCIVHGHSIVDMPEFYPNRIAIDTGAYYSGRLTCLVLEGQERRFLQT